MTGHGYKAQYDYVELTVEPQGDHWRLTLRDNRHSENVVHEDDFATAEEAKESALPLAVFHINVQHNDTVVMSNALAWKEYQVGSAGADQ